VMILAIETSCDETSVGLVAVESGRAHIASHQVLSQIETHRPFGGVVPEVATREHMRHLGPMVQEVLHEAGVRVEQIDGVAVTGGPGLASSLMVGHAYGCGLALAASKPLTCINHLEGHLVSPFLTSAEPPVYPHLACIVSGGHTLLIEVRAPWSYRCLGRTRDDAVGEAFDKVAKLLGLAYPGGPEVEVRAGKGDPERFSFPRSMAQSGDLHFSFSGLKTAVRYLLPKLTQPLSEKDKNDCCASFQQAVVDIFCRKVGDALERTGVSLLTLSGGVSGNRILAGAIRKVCVSKGVRFEVAQPKWSTDNAGMIGYAAALRWEDGCFEQKDQDVDPNWMLPGCD